MTSIYNMMIVNGQVIMGGTEKKIVKLSITYEDGEVEDTLLGQTDSLKLELKGDVHGDVQLAHGKLSVHGDVGGKASTNHGDVTVGGHVGGHVKSNMGNIDVKGSVQGSASTNMGDITIKGK